MDLDATLAAFRSERDQAERNYRFTLERIASLTSDYAGRRPTDRASHHVINVAAELQTAAVKHEAACAALRFFGVTE